MLKFHANFQWYSQTLDILDATRSTTSVAVGSGEVPTIKNHPSSIPKFKGPCNTVILSQPNLIGKL